MTTAKVFWSGNSQAIRLPKKFRLAPDIEEVIVQKKGEQLILVPVQPDEWPKDFLKPSAKCPGTLNGPGVSRPAAKSSTFEIPPRYQHLHLRP